MGSQRDRETERQSSKCVVRRPRFVRRCSPREKAEENTFALAKGIRYSGVIQERLVARQSLPKSVSSMTAAAL